MKSIAFFVVYFFSESLCLLLGTAALFSNETDKLALLSFKLQIINDPSEVLSSWNDSTDFCNWEGVSCSQKNLGRVMSINLSSRALSGYISSSIANLTFLHFLDLSENQFSGTIPPSLFSLSRLHTLVLSINSLHGEIPFNLSSSLAILDLNGNYISGSIPPSLGHLSKLSFVCLSNNSLTGKIPPSLGNLSSLQHLALRTNKFEGSIPHEIGNHRWLEYLQISDNMLSGDLPASIFNLSSAYYFAIAKNNFEGMIPATFGKNLPNLQELIMGGNLLTGSISATLPNASKMFFIDMSYNSLSGTIPNFGRLGNLSQVNLEFNLLEARDYESWQFLDALTNCSQLKMLCLDNNKLGGTLPSAIANLSTLIQELRINMNQISGMIPSGIGNLINLNVLALGPNLLTGEIPVSIAKLTKLHLLTLHRSMLTGPIPSSIGNLTQLEYLYLARNRLNGPIPPAIGNLKILAELSIYSNYLIGNIPKEIFRLPSITALSLAKNSLIGSIPSEIGGLKYLIKLYINENRLSGEIPKSISDCLNLEVLDLSRNLIEGTIPQSIVKLKDLRQLDLSENNLSGPIPETLGRMRSLKNLNLSFNHLSGEVPREGVFLNATEASLHGNFLLCGGVPDLHLPNCSHESSLEKRRQSLWPRRLAILAAGMTVFLLILLPILCFICKRNYLCKKSSNPRIMKYVFPKVSYTELVKATDGFSSANLLGIGHYGSVYKGSLDNYDYTNMAVKVFNLRQRGASEAFFTECETLRCIRHRNIVKILTACVGIDSKRNDFMALVLEFMPNGNLDTWLHADECRTEHLNLVQRLDIAINIANALAYLHHDCETPIIHCDLKPSNILLDGDMVAHVGDFGIARVLFDTACNPLNDSDIFPVIRGSIGYVAPEYSLGNQVSIMGDVYSFGILLMELFTGRRPVDSFFRDGLSLPKFVEMAIPHRVMEVIDPVLQQHSQRATNECLVSILLLSLACSKESPRERTSMRDAAVELHSIRTFFIESQLPEQ